MYVDTNQRTDVRVFGKLYWTKYNVDSVSYTLIFYTLYIDDNEPSERIGQKYIQNRKRNFHIRRCCGPADFCEARVLRNISKIGK